VPQGGWVTNAHRDHPDMHTHCIDHDEWQHHGHDDCYRMHDYYRDSWGDGWWGRPHGFYCGDNFWFGFEIGLLCGNNCNDNPIYVINPATGDNCGQVFPPDGSNTFDNKVQAQLAVLNVMAHPQQDPDSQYYDPTAGLYKPDENGHFDPTNLGPKIEADEALVRLRHGDPIYYHPINGDFQTLQDQTDLDVYTYSLETKDNAPPQD
jgi:hypothetical protein